MGEVNSESIERFRRLIDREIERRGLTPPAPEPEVASGPQRTREFLEQIDSFAHRLVELRDRGEEASWALVDRVAGEVRAGVARFVRGR